MKYLELFLLLFVFLGSGIAPLYPVIGIAYVPSPVEGIRTPLTEYLDSQRCGPGHHLGHKSKSAFYDVKLRSFDCEYYTQELEELYTTNIDDFETVAYILEQLKSLGCLETDPTLKMIQAQYDLLQAAIKPEAERDPLSNSEVDQAIQEGNYHEAIRLLNVAMDGETDGFKKGMYSFQIASIQYKELGLFEQARNNARRAAELASDFGKTYLLLGDIYLKMSRNCGESWQESLAVLAAIEKYEHARNIDTSVVIEANRRILNLMGSLPLREDGFRRSVNPGDKVFVRCGIDETITIRFQ
ncbi:hypothetical protein SAMN05192553_102602 [Cyclobacterium xiamenense]|uniref:Tetratricopeptide repeat-containing protein n=1 Tax=Cyclobacterium xiamenense TaxID=1297121 RepID=A0A1H6WB98_9BACT|nr:hypothetical protein [Cyclobacterium xiamenense]SEJ14311.1 hypothetical protein SAMN05192553_102602 [Cyclobacterium xiamenense]